jgi:hypothetical protein
MWQFGANCGDFVGGKIWKSLIRESPTLRRGEIRRFLSQQEQQFQKRVERIMQNYSRRGTGFNNKTRSRTYTELVVIENSAIPVAENVEICDYIASLVSELSDLSKNLNEDVLEGLLNLTAQEARNAKDRKQRHGLHASCGHV